VFLLILINKSHRMVSFGINEMSFPYQMVLYLLCFEVVLFIGILFPWPKKWRRSLLVNMSTSDMTKKLGSLIKILFFVVCLLFIGRSYCLLSFLVEKFILRLDSCMKMFRADKEYRLLSIIGQHSHTRDLEKSDLQFRMRLFYIQRNLFLTGFTIFITL
jgi:B-cell receptor-associated protein 31